MLRIARSQPRAASLESIYIKVNEVPNMIKVVKIGGNVVDNEELLRQFCRDFAQLQSPKLLVHGGGAPLASRMQKQLGMEPKMIEGRRVTDEDTLRIVTMVYAGWCNKHISALLQAAGCNALGLSGCDASVITAGRRPPKTLSDGCHARRLRLCRRRDPGIRQLGGDTRISGLRTGARLLRHQPRRTRKPAQHQRRHRGVEHFLQH